MATTKPSKERPSLQPRLQPRPTAASAARAARNATNRNLSAAQQQRQSPNRQPPSPTLRRGRNLKSDSKGDLKSNRPSEVDLPDNNNLQLMAKQESSSFVIETNAPIVEEAGDGKDVYIKMQHEELDLSIQMNIGQLINAPDSEINNPSIASLDVNEKSVDFELGNQADLGNQAFVIVKSEDCSSRPQTPAEDMTPTPSAPSSRPQTPRQKSRPQTPRCQSHPQTTRNQSRPQTPVSESRPQTPLRYSRPTTPVHPCQQTSRPSTPQSTTSSITRPQRCALSAPTLARVPTPNSQQSHTPVKEEDDLQSMFITTRRQFHSLKKELDLKQLAVLEVFDCLKTINARMAAEGSCGEGMPVELVMFNVGDWTTEEIAQLCLEANASNGTAIDILHKTHQYDDNMLAELDSNLSKVPSRFAELCLQAYTARQEVIDWVKELVGKIEEDGRGECLDRIGRYNTEGLELCENLRALKSLADEAIDTIAQLTKRACRDRSALIAVGESLVRETARLRQDLDEIRSGMSNEKRGEREAPADSETLKALEDARRELEEERVNKMSMKEKLGNTESQLRQARGRVTKMDRQLREAEATITSLTATVKSLEDQSRQKEVHLEARARKLRESLKTGEITSNQIAQQRDALQTEVQTLKERIEQLESSNKTKVQELSKEIKELKTECEEQKQLLETTTAEKIVLEGKIKESEKLVQELRAKVTELECAQQNPELPTEREMDLYAELQATKDTLRMTEEEVNACKREKARFIETLTKITDSDNKVAMQQKLAAELLSKEEIINKMQIQMRELTKNIRLNEQKLIQYEQYVHDLQAYHRAVANCKEAPNGISYEDLQQEIMNLRMSLLEAVHRNEEISEVLAQKEQQLEQQDKTSRAQARVIKVREELINMLKNKETEQSRELSALQQDLEHRMKIVDEVNKQIASKAEEIQELFATLENKQQQIHRLEKIVLALEEQQRRAQAQRTRHEEKIAALEHELAAGNRRERKFIFF